MKIQSINNSIANNNLNPVFKSAFGQKNGLTANEVAFLLSSPQDMDEYLRSSDAANGSDAVSSNPLTAIAKKLIKMFNILSSNPSSKKILSTDPKEVDQGFEDIYRMIYQGT